VIGRQLALIVAPWHDRAQNLFRMTQVCFERLADTGATPSDFLLHLVILELI